MQKDLKEQIEKYFKKDQEVRNKNIEKPSDKELASAIVEQDEQTREFVKEVLEEHGWPRYSTVGEEAHLFWNLAQHMDMDPELQRKALSLLEQAVEDNEASITDMAYLTDRVLKNENKKQKYGTQFMIKNKELYLYPTQNLEEVDSLRKEVGLPTLDQEREILKEEYKNLLD